MSRTVVKEAVPGFEGIGIEPTRIYKARMHANF